MTTIPFNNGGPVVRDGKVIASDTCCDGVCCGGEWRTPKDSGECCAGVWHPNDNPCPEGEVFLRWGEGDACCGCLPEQIFDGRVNGMVNTVDVVDDLCCPLCSAVGIPAPLLPFDAQGNLVGCKGRCCDGNNCTDTLEADCIHEWSALRCCYDGCPQSCCTEDANGLVVCETTEPEDCVGTLDTEPCPTACKGACCVEEDGELVPHENSPMTQAECEAAGGQFQGVGSTECEKCEDGLFRCREPLTLCCCETHASKGYGLTFYQPRKSRQPEFSDTLEVTVTGTTKSPIRIHGTLVAPTAECSCEFVSFSHTFVMCWDAFNIEPVPCGSAFCDLSVTVCWKQLPTDTESLEFSGCNDITVWLGNCEYDCVTTLLYTGPGHTSNATIVMRGDATIDASGTDPLILTTPITHAGNCARTLTLTGTNAEDNEIAGAISDASMTYTTTVVKRGTGLWVLSGANTFTEPVQVKQGTLVAGRDAFGSSGAFGAASVQEVLVGDTASGIGGTARLFIDGGFSTDKVISVQSSSGNQTVVLGGRGSGTVDFQNDVRLGRAVTLVADSGSTTFFGGFIKNAAGTGDPTVDITFGMPGYTGEVRMVRTLNTSGTVSFLYGTVLFTNIKTNPGDRAASATFTNTTLTVDFTGDPAPGSQYVLFGGSTQQTYTPALTGTAATGTYNSATSTLTIN